MDDGLTVEFFDDRPVAPGVGPAPDRRRLRALKHPGFAALVAVVALVAAALVAVRLMPEDPWPLVVVDVPAKAGPARGQLDRWRAGPDGRPGPRVQFAENALVERAVPPGTSGLGDIPFRILGVVGPGIDRSDGPAVALGAPGVTVPAPLTADVDCLRVPEVVPDDAYRLRVQTGPATGGPSRVVPVPAASQVWAHVVQLSCASWEARRALTVTALTTHVHPAAAALDVTITVANAGDRRATLDRAILDPVARFTGLASSIDGPLPLAVPPRASATATVTLQLRDCDTVSGPTAQSPELTSLLGLIALAGPRPTGGLPEDRFGEGDRATGVVLAAPADDALHRGLDAACGGLRPPVTSVAPGGLHRDARSGRTTLDVDIRFPAGRVRALTLEADETALGNGSTTLMTLGGDSTAISSTVVAHIHWTTTGTLVPDASGHVRSQLVLDLPGTSTGCTGTLLALPGALITAWVRDGGGERKVHYQLPVEVQKMVAQALRCPPKR